MPAERTLPRPLRNLFIGAFACLLLATLLGQFQTTTQMLPYHNRVENFCLYAPFFLALLSACLVAWRAYGFPWWTRLYWAICTALLFALGSFLLFSNTASLIQGRLDFPAGRTKTFPAQLALSRAYMMTGKGRSWHVQTMPVWTDLDITETDYTWMLHHRRHDDAGVREEEIKSLGYFCVSVTLQQAGDALRVLHAGSHTLPSGTVRLCPNASE